MLLTASIVVAIAQISSGPMIQNDWSAPALVSVTPDADSTVAPGPIKVRLTFDRLMKADKFSLVNGADADPLACAERPELSDDRRTFTFDCMAQPGKNYVLWVNPNIHGFRAADGHFAPASRFRFSVASS